jgi:hypothetical protein
VKVKFVLNSNRFVIYKEFSKLEKFSILFVGHGPKPVLPRNRPRLVFFFLGGPTFLSFFSSRERPTTAGMIGPISARLLGRYSPTQAHRLGLRCRHGPAVRRLSAATHPPGVHAMLLELVRALDSMLKPCHARTPPKLGSDRKKQGFGRFFESEKEIIR